MIIRLKYREVELHFSHHLPLIVSTCFTHLFDAQSFRSSFSSSLAFLASNGSLQNGWSRLLHVQHLMADAKNIRNSLFPSCWRATNTSTHTDNTTLLLSWLKWIRNLSYFTRSQTLTSVFSRRVTCLWQVLILSSFVRTLMYFDHHDESNCQQF